MKKVRIRSEMIVRDHRAKGGQVHFIRVNPHEPQLPDEQHDMNYGNKTLTHSLSYTSLYLFLCVYYYYYYYLLSSFAVQGFRCTVWP